MGSPSHGSARGRRTWSSPAWFRHAAPIVTRGGHAFTEAGRVHGSWRAPRGDDSRPRHPVAREWNATPVDSVRRLVRPHAPIVIPALRLISNSSEFSSVIEDAQNAFGTAICPPGRVYFCKRASASDMYNSYKGCLPPMTRMLWARCAALPSLAVDLGRARRTEFRAAWHGRTVHRTVPRHAQDLRARAH